MTLARCAPSGPPPRRKSASRKASLNSLIALAAILAASNTAWAQGADINDAVTMEDLGLTTRLHTGARPAGMAGAYTAVGDDIHALVYNPAGLARLKRVELGLGFLHARDELDHVFYGSPSSVSLSATRLDFVAGAYPLPTYRGSFVVAFGAYHMLSSDIDILYRGYNTRTETNDDYRLQQSGSILGYNVGFGLDLSPSLAIGGSAFLLDGTINALTQLQYGPNPPFSDGSLTGVSIADDAEVDLDGIGAVLGLQYHPHPRLRLGSTVSTPIRIDIDGGAQTEEIDFYFNSPDTLSEQSFTIETQFTLPYRVDAGIGLTLGKLLFSTSIAYTDWAQVTIDGFQLKDRNLSAVFRDVVEVRTGIEFTIPNAPARVRAGYAYLPYPLRYLQGDRIEGNRIEKAKVDREQQLFTGGLGFLAGRVVTIDAAYEYRQGDRSIPALSSSRSTQRVLLSAAYRF